MIVADPLLPGDKVAIISPATRVRDEYIDGAAEWLRRNGFVPVIGRHAYGPADGNYASARLNRLSDLNDALFDPEIKAILCARGGYGCNQLVNEFSPDVLRDNPKWMIGFSDVSALHAMMNAAGVMSLHAPMAKHLTIEPENHPASLAMLDILRGARSESYSFPHHPLDRDGSAAGRLKGGNLAVLDGLSGTPFDMLSAEALDGAILFIEDIAEPLYKIDRMLTRIWLSGALNRINGLVVGQFTEYGPDAKFEDVCALIDSKLDEWGISSIPVAYGAPCGHVSDNMPMVCGAWASLSVGAEGVSLDMKIRN